MKLHDLLKLLARADVYCGVWTSLTLLAVIAVLMWGTV